MSLYDGDSCPGGVRGNHINAKGEEEEEEVPIEAPVPVPARGV